MKKVYFILPCFFLCSLISLGQINKAGKSESYDTKISMSNCTPSVAQADLDINNVRARILVAGDLWWDLSNSAYEIPKGSGKKSLFCGSLWIGGKDASNNLYTATQTYRQSGNDFWPGPLDTATAAIDNIQCQKFDKLFKITRMEVQDFYNQYVVGGNHSYPVPDAIKNWPGNGDPGKSQFLAPFYDYNADGIYDWRDGDYPAYNNIANQGTGECKNYLHGDQTIWWVFNDAGNTHNNSFSLNPFGLEIRAQAFAFASADVDVNNATFYSYSIINRSANTYSNVHIGNYTDVDLGNYLDDYVGCDVGRNLGYAYNGDNDDNGPLGYGVNPPAVGLDILQGPLADVDDNIDNNRNGSMDELGEEIAMSKFVYYNNDGSNYGNPNTSQYFYNYLNGIWKDGTQIMYGNISIPADFMFPGDSDPQNWGTDGVDPGFQWTETQNCLSGCAPNTPADRRFLMSSGGFTFHPGQVTNYTVAVVWARASSGGPLASLQKLKLADDKIQKFFNSCFDALAIGIPEMHAVQSSVFPNPAREEITIRLSDYSNEKLTLRIFNSLGQLVVNKQVVENEIRINTASLNAGAYHFTIEGKADQKSTGKFVVIE